MPTRTRHRPPSRRARPTAVRARSTPVLAAVAAAALVAAALVMITRSGPDDPVVTVVFAEQITAEEAAPTVPAGLVDRVDQLAPSGRNRLVVVTAAGDGGRRAGPEVALRVEREPGRLENDPTARHAGVTQLVAGTLAAANATPAAGAGRDLAGLLSAVSAVRGPGPNEVWLRTFGLATVDPADARVLMAADPHQAAAIVAAALPGLALDRTAVHLILAAPSGDQPWPNQPTRAWRRAFVVDLLRVLGADVVSVDEEVVARPAVVGAPSAPVVPNLPDPTPLVAPPSSAGPVEVPLDTAAFFAPDSAEFAAGPDAATAALAPLVAMARSRPHARIEVVGRCARFGPADSARALSRERAAAVAVLLRQAGLTVDDAAVRGLGYDDPLPPDPRDPTNRRVTVTLDPT